MPRRTDDGGTLVVANDAFFQRPQAAAVLKHGILGRYSVVFTAMAGSRGSGRVVYFDGYAGPGRYGDGAPGSPLLAVGTAARSAAYGRTLECVFVEQDARFAANLEKVLAAEAPSGITYLVRQGDVAEHVDLVLQMARTDPLLTFLDPFGTPLDRELLTGKLLARPASQPTEVLLNLNVEAVGRIGGLLGAKHPRGSDQVALGRLDAAFGHWWRETFLAVYRPGVAGTAAEAAQAVASQFMEQVHHECGYGHVAVPVRRRPNHQPLFLLILFTRYRAAPWKFNEQVSLANSDWRRACAEADLEATLDELGQQEDLFGDKTATWARETAEDAWERQEALHEKSWVDLIAGNLAQLLTSQPAVPLVPSMSAVYGSAFGLARDKHVNKAWDRLAKAGIAQPRPKGERLESLQVLRAAG